MNSDVAGMESPRTWPVGPRVEEVLAARPARPISLQAQNDALCELAQALARADGDVLQQLADRALVLCGAHSAGVSLIELDGAERVFRWHAVAGRWSNYVMGSMPRNLSPCGIVVDRHAAQVMPDPDLYFPAMRLAIPLAKEALLVPFDVLGETVGTVWVVSHEEGVRFTADDLRMIESLAHFAAAAYLAQVTLRRSLDDRAELLRMTERVNRENAKLREKLTQDEVR